MTTSNNVTFSIRSKESHRARFNNILLALSNNHVQLNFFRQSLNFLCIPEFDDIVEERNANNACGYVLCDVFIKIKPKAVICLDPNARKIYNISNRKKFCSDWCYGAFKFISDQLPSEPLWKLNVPQIKNNIKFYPKNAIGCPGEIHYDELMDQNSDEDKRMIDIPQNECVNSNYVKRIEKVQTVITALDNLIIDKKKNDLNSKVDESEIKIVKKVNNSENDKNIDKESTNKKINIISKKNVVIVKKNENTNKPKDFDEVLKSVKAKIANKSEKKTIFIDEPINESNVITSSNEKEILSIIKKSSDIICEWITDNTRDYLCSTMNNANDSDDDEDDDDDDKGRLFEEDEEPIFAPNIDSSNQIIIRRGLLLKRMKTTCVPILGDFNLNVNTFIAEFTRFIGTCRLNSRNIIFTGKEFKWLTILLIDILYPKLINGKSHLNKSSVLKKHGIEILSLYEDIYSNIEKQIGYCDGSEGSLVSSKGDYN